MPARQHWHQCESWEELAADPALVAQWLADRDAALEWPDFDWSRVFTEIAPALDLDRETIGLINLDAGHRLRIIEMETDGSAAVNEYGHIGIDPQLAARFYSRPALFIFHTHPRRSAPLPSAYDISTAIINGCQGRFAASVVLSRYGAIVYGPRPDLVDDLFAHKNYPEAIYTAMLDAFSSYSAIRAWGPHSLQDIGEKFYERHRLLFLAYPSPDMVADGLYMFHTPPDSTPPVDFEHLGLYRDAVRACADKPELADDPRVRQEFLWWRQGTPSGGAGTGAGAIEDSRPRWRQHWHQATVGSVRVPDSPPVYGSLR